MQKVDLSTLNHDGVHGCATGWQQRSCWFDPPDGMENYVFGMWLVSKIASIFQTHVRLFYKNETIGPEFLHVSVYIRKTRSRDSRMELKTDYSLDHWCSILLLSTCTILCIYPMFHRAILQQSRRHESGICTSPSPGPWRARRLDSTVWTLVFGWPQLGLILPVRFPSWSKYILGSRVELN